MIVALLVLVLGQEAVSRGDLRKLNPAFEPGWVREHWVWKAPYAQPVVTHDYLRRLPPHETPSVDSS